MPTQHRILLAAALVFFALAAHAGAPGGSPIWGVKSKAGVGIASIPPANLLVFTIPSPGALVDKGAIKLGGVEIDVDGLAQLPSSQLVGFELGPAGSRLVSIDSANATATVIGPLLAGRNIRAAVARPDGVLLAIDAAESTLIAVSSTTGMLFGASHVVRIGCTPIVVSTAADLAIRGDGLLLLVSFNQFFAVDQATGAMQLLHTDMVPMPDGQIPFIGGLAFEPASTVAAAYELNSDDDLLTYDTGGGFARTIILANIIPAFNAGRGDLACFVNANPAPLPGQVIADLNGDGVIDGADLGLLLGAWGPCPPPQQACCADLNGDGVVNGADLGIMLGAWG